MSLRLSHLVHYLTKRGPTTQRIKYHQIGFNAVQVNFEIQVYGNKIICLKLLLVDRQFIIIKISLYEFGNSYMILIVYVKDVEKTSTLNNNVNMNF